MDANGSPRRQLDPFRVPPVLIALTLLLAAALAVTFILVAQIIQTP